MSVWLVVITPAFSAATVPAKSNTVQKVVVHKRTSNFIDVEAPINQVWVGCNRDGPMSEATSGMGFYALDGNVAYEFHFRRADDVAWCLKVQKEYRRLMRGAKTVRLVGIHPLEEPFNPDVSSEERMPRRFTAASKTFAHIFIRMQVGDRCQAYFSKDCKLPENYWGGTIPQPASEMTPKRVNVK